MRNANSVNANIVLNGIFWPESLANIDRQLCTIFLKLSAIFEHITQVWTQNITRIIEMSGINQQGDSKTRFKLTFDLNDYPYDAHYTPKCEPQREIVLRDDTIYPQIDCARLIPLMGTVIHVRDMKYYYYLLSQLTTNDVPITIVMQDLRALFKDNFTVQVYQGYERLCKAGLIFKQPNRRSTYFVNPAYAWKGNRADYLDISTLPLK